LLWENHVFFILPPSPLNIFCNQLVTKFLRITKILFSAPGPLFLHLNIKRDFLEARKFRWNWKKGQPFGKEKWETREGRTSWEKAGFWKDGG
jgi:hypothetical protein